MRSRFLLLPVMLILRPRPADSQLLSILADVVLPLILNPKETFRRRKLQCAFKALVSALAAGYLADDRNLVNMFKEDSVMQLAQAGAYVGPDDVGEYMGFIDARTTPYLKFSNTDAFTGEIIGYDEETKQCEFTYFTKSSYTTDPDKTVGEVSFSTALMSRLFLDYKGKFMTRINILYPKGFLGLVFADLIGGEKTQSFICNSVLNGACSEVLPTTDDCTASLAALEKAEGVDLYVDGNSLGCRALHSAFAYKNQYHCPHVSLTRTADAQNRIRCQDSQGVPISDLFSTKQIEKFDQFMEKNGIDPEVGYADE